MSRARSITNGPPERRAVSTRRSACFNAWRSEPQMPQASVFTSTSPGPGSGTATSATTSFFRRITAARMSSSLVLFQSAERDHACGVERRGALVDLLHDAPLIDDERRALRDATAGIEDSVVLRYLLLLVRAERV